MAPCCSNSQPPTSPSRRSPVTADDSKPDGQSSSTESAPCDTSGHTRRFGLAPGQKPRTNTALAQMRAALVVDKARPPTHPDAVAPSSLAVLIHPAVDDDRAVGAHAPVAPLRVRLWCAPT